MKTLYLNNVCLFYTMEIENINIDTIIDKLLGPEDTIECSDEICTVSVYNNDNDQKQVDITKLKKTELEKILEDYYTQHKVQYTKTSLKKKKKEELLKEITKLNIFSNP